MNSIRGTCGHPMECLTVIWDRGMGWTVGHTWICRETGSPVECPTVPWDCGMGWTIYGISGYLFEVTYHLSLKTIDCFK